jgi:WD40 repeat protein
LEQTLTGSSGAVTALAFLDEKQLLSTGGDTRVRVWDAAAGKALAEWTGHTAAVLALAARPDGSAIVSGGADKTVIEWDRATGKPNWTWNARSTVTALAARDDGIVAVGSADGSLSILKSAKDKPTVLASRNGHISGTAAAVFHPKGSGLATVGGDGAPRLWSLDAAGKLTLAHTLSPAVKPATGEPIALSACVYSPDGTTLATAGADRVVRMWTVSDGKEFRVLRGAGEWITAIGYLSADRLLAVGTDAIARVFDLPRYEAQNLSGHSQLARSVALRGDGKRAVSVGDDGTLRIWDLDSGLELTTQKVSGRPILVAAHLTDDRLALAGNDDRLRTWSLADRKHLSITPVTGLFGMAASSDGSRIATWSNASDGARYSLFDLAAKTQSADPVNPFRPADSAPKLTPKITIPERGHAITCVAFNSKITHVVSGHTVKVENKEKKTSTNEGHVTVFDFETGNAVGTAWKLFDVPVGDVALSPDAATLYAVASDGAIVIVDVKSHEVKRRAKGPANGIDGLILAPAGDRFAILGRDRVAMAFTSDGESIKSVALPVSANGAAFSTDGKKLLTANADGSLCLIDLAK